MTLDDLPLLFLILAVIAFIIGRVRPWHRHRFTNSLTVSGYGYTEYRVWFCEHCPKVFGVQTKGQR